MPQLAPRVKFLLSKKQVWKPITAVIVGMVVILAANCAGRATGNIAGWWTNWADPLITVATVIAAVLAWWETSNQAWEQDLPKRLNVHFTYQEEYVFTCWEAILTGESDIRQWAQQIGRQMHVAGMPDEEKEDSRKANLDFGPNPKIPSPTIGDNDIIGPFRLYEITINLISPPRCEGYRVWELTPGSERLAERLFPQRPTESMHINAADSSKDER